MNTSMDISRVKYEFGPSVFYLFCPLVIFFGPWVFYLFSPPDSVYRTSSVRKLDMQLIYFEFILSGLRQR